MAKTAARLVNTYDLPELQWGPDAHRGESTTRRYHEIHVEEVRREMRREQVRSAEASAMKTASGAAVTTTHLESMFPALDPSLVKVILTEAVAPAQAIETLLALSASAAEPATAQPSAPTEDVRVDDHRTFPVLVDGDGWQVVNRRVLDRDDDETAGSVWRDRAKAAAGLPQQKITRPAKATTVRARPRPAQRRSSTSIAVTEEIADAPTLAAEYELRQQSGQRRAACRGGRGSNVSRTGSGVACDEGDEVSESETKVSPSTKAQFEG